MITENDRKLLSLEFAKLRASRAFWPYVPSRLTQAPYRRALRAFFTGLAHLVRLKIFLAWICNPAEIFHFPRTIKGTTNCAVFMWVKKQP